MNYPTDASLNQRTRRFGGRASLVALALLSMASQAQAQNQTATQDSKDGGDIIVTGTRQSGVSANKSLSPIDVVSSETLASTGQNNLSAALNQLLPSVNRQAQGTTVAALTDSINLRGLSPNQTLVLVNGKRRHATTNIFTDAGPFRGATPVDISLIPASAVDHIEVLRDGASAQYGSDAVAGVVNIILKDQTGGYASVQSGLYGQGDGFTQNADAGYGWKLGDRGSINASVDYQHKARTDRTGVDTQTGLRDSHWIGDPASDRIDLALNGKYKLSDAVEFYGNATYAHRTANTYQIYRLPTVLPALYPNGFSPRLGSIENDFAVTAGLRGDNLAGFGWDVSSTYGSDAISYNMWDSANTTLYARTGSTPTSFHLKDLRNQQWTNDIDLTRKLGPINLALGGEHRRETFHEGAGDDASTIYGGSQAVPGVLATSAGTWQRDVLALYGDAAVNLTKAWQVDGAARWEHYSEFGGTWSGKVATRYDFSRAFALRGTWSTGLRAPTLAEEHHTAATVTTSGATGQLPPTSPGAQLLGATPLRPERSRSLSFGFTARPLDRLSIQVDAYKIILRDRILDGGSYSGAQAVAAYLANGRSLPDGYTLSAVSASYLTNAADTRTRGLDINANWRVDLTANSKVVFDVAANFNDTKIERIKLNSLGNQVLNAQQIAFLTTAQPHSTQIAGFTWSNPRWSVALHGQRYGHIFDQMTYQQGANAFSTSVFQPFRAAPITVVNLAVDYKVNRRVDLAVGGNNIFNTYPTKVPTLAQYYGQALYDRYAQQTTFNGGFYYIRLGIKL
jgi:iron complex outermembrane recepter protein